MAIRILPETTANRIAAGEVVERPAAVVKELVENALDAGATRIAVTLEEGGIGRIIVEDDGHGMPADDLALAVERHATSKLPEEALLFRIASLGFRGEALPSIGAVARLTITSRPPGADAHAITVEGGRKSEVTPAAGPPGTRIEVRDLFYAVPARRKFLRQPRAEAEAAMDALRRLALAWPEVGFRATIDGREVLALLPAARDARIAALLGPDFAAAALPVEHSAGDLALSGLLAQPGYTRATATEQHLVVNRRPVRDPILRTALRVATREVIAAGRHPVAALFLTLPPEAVDVNVHPMKTELRFREEAAVRGLIISALRRALSVGAGGALAAPSRPAFSMPRPGPRPTPGWRVPADMLRGATAAQGWDATPAGGPPAGAAGPPGLSGFAEALVAPLDQPGAAGRPDAPLARWDLTPAATPMVGPAVLPLGFAPPRPAPAAPAAPPDPAHPLGRAVGQILNTYVLAEAPDGALVLVDQHAAHERLTHEALRAEYLDGGVRAQPLLLPAVVDLPAGAAHRLLAAAPALARLGLEIEGFGPGAVLVRAMPALLGQPEPAPLLRDLAEELAESAEPEALTARLEAAIARLACHGSVRAGRRLLPAEMDALLRQMEATPRAATCSHGRPTFLRLGPAELERLFGRR